MLEIIPKLKTDNKDGQRGDFYQILVAIKYALEDIDNSFKTLIIEHQGDVTFDTKIQIEVKHHDPKISLGDCNIDFWKTLNNWCTPEHDYTKYEKLILYTTSYFPKQGITYLKSWNKQDTGNRYQTILKIISSNPPKNILEYIRFIESLDVEKLKSILSKIIIKDNQPIDKDLIIELSENPTIKALAYKKEDRINIVEDRIAGSIKSKIAGAGRWEISNEQLFNIIRIIGCDFLNENYRPVFDKYLKREIDNSDYSNYTEKKFVKELNEISCGEDEVREAINDFWKSTTLLVEQNEKDPFFNENEFIPYKEKIVLPKLKIQRNIHLLNNKKNNLLFYYNCKDINLNGYKGIPDLFYFKHGTMQILVEDIDNNFNWIL